MKRTIETYVPIFNGFGYTNFSDLLDSNVEDYFETDDINYDNVDIKKTKTNILNSVLELVTKNLNENGIICTSFFEELISPRFYNYTNDSGNCTFEFNDFDVVIKILEDNIEKFNEYIKEKYTSYDGFCSYYSNDGNEWINELKNTDNNLKHQCGQVLEFILTNVFDFNEEELLSELYNENFCVLITE